MNLSPSQLAAVERSNQDVCVVAGPGSGKTRVLTERFAWLVEFHHVNPARILAITFTEKAATEIKERLVRRFAADPELRESIERAWVSTIDGFCTRLLQEHSEAAQIPSDFSILDPSAAERLARESAEEALDDLFAEKPVEMRELLESLDLSTSDFGPKPDLAQSVIEVYESMRLSGSMDFPDQPPMEDVLGEARRVARSILDDPGKHGSATGELLDWAETFLALPPLITREHFAVASSLKVHAGQVGKTRSADTKRLKDEILPLLRAQWIETWNDGPMRLVREAIQRFDRAYRAKKRDRSALDFADLEEESIRLLESDFFIREATRTRFDQILMDELQDTNRLQWRLLNLIRSPDSFFAVGDINQSIYGFRHADPEVFEEYRRDLEHSGATIDDLRENHRSRQAILDAVARVLDGQPGIEPRPLTAFRQFGPALSSIGGPIVERLVGEGDDGEANLVAARICELVEAGECEYRDIAVLVRSLSSLDPFTRALDRFNVPFIVTGGRTFIEAREIRDLIAFLTVLADPTDEIALVGVLRGPIVGLTDDQILGIGKTGWRQVFESRFGHLRDRVDFISADRLLPEQPYLSPRARANVDKLRALLRRERGKPLAQILDDFTYLREPEAAPPEAGNVLELMSIHSAKGLEFKVVFITALHRDPDRSSPVLFRSGAKWRNPATGEAQPDRAYTAQKHEKRQKEEAEENRLLYVAMTRAEQRLFLTYTKTRHGRKWQKLVESAVPDECTTIFAAPRPLAAESETIRFVKANS